MNIQRHECKCICAGAHADTHVLTKIILSQLEYIHCKRDYWLCFRCVRVVTVLKKNVQPKFQSWTRII